MSCYYGGYLLLLLLLFSPSSYSPLLSLPAPLPIPSSPYPLLIPLAPKQQMFMEGNLFLYSLKAAHFETIGAHLYILKCMGAPKVLL